MKENLYLVTHIYDVDGGFGDAIMEESVVGIVRCGEEDIKKFIEKYNKPTVYDVPYSYLTCHELSYSEVEILSMEDIVKNPYGDNGHFERLIKSFEKRDPERFKEANEDLQEEL